MLGEAKQAAVRQAVLDYRPSDVGLVGQLWTRSLIGDLIAKLYRVRLTEPGVGKYLKRWGLSFRRPDKRAVEQDPQAVRRWHEETLPAIRARAKAEGGEILFADRCPFRSGHRPDLGREGAYPDRAAHGQPVLGERDVRDQHQGPDALHGLH
ncbi:helix-turn-helix domain-containing protein [Streptomyces chryseus]|uniref:helix-turn-helix domain-containing protein n=1 Tax=Streptomyces chryseus TaxID=68186 RepID=UPI003F728E08